MISPATLAASDTLRAAFRTAEPFPHVVIEQFFEPDTMVALAEQFPSFEARNALNEFGEVGGKAVVTQLATLGPAYRELQQYLNSRPFLEAMSALTGIPDLLPDPALYGGGTHENVEGQELDAHVDYNYINGGSLHRRLNLLLYFNPEWDESWGGCIELHSNPRRPAENQIKQFAPLYNRALIFETSEHSWHGFRKIVLPGDRKGLTRRSLAVYLYTRTRPEDEIAPPHSTFYVQRPLPAWCRGGKLLSEADATELANLLKRRDDWIEFYQHKELRDSAEIQRLQTARPQCGRGQAGGVGWLTTLRYPPLLARRLYYNLPLTDTGRVRLKDTVFRHAGFLFKKRQVYRNWLAQQGQTKPSAK